MKSINIKKAAKDFIKKLNVIITFDSFTNYLQKEGYTVMYYSAPECALLFDKYNLSDYAKAVNAFTYVCNSVEVVFIDDSISFNNMLCAIAHESAHVYLGHLKINKYAIDDRHIEMEAEALAYEVLHHKNGKDTIKTVAITVLVFCMMYLLGTNIALHKKVEHYNTVQASASVSASVPKTHVTTTIEPEEIEANPETSETVLVTPSGKKFHRSDCRYVKNKNCITLSRTEASKKYTPCSVCRP